MLEAMVQLSVRRLFWSALAATALGGGAAERSVTGSVLHLGGGTDIVDEPLPIPRFSEAQAEVRLDGNLDEARCPPTTA